MSASSSIARTVRAGVGADSAHGAVMPPIYLTSNFVFDRPGECGRFDYSRTANPTRSLCAEAVADLEGGAGAVVTNSGMSAISTIARLLQPNDLVVAAFDCYGGTHRLFSREAEKGSYRVAFEDVYAADAHERALLLSPAMIWLESPSNPLMRIADIARWAETARKAGALLVVDNTFLSPINQKPLALGADIVAHSATKFLNGHGDLIAGAIIATDAAVLEELDWWANAAGASGPSFDAWLLLRGMRTLHLRIQAANENALAVARLLEDAMADGAVRAVHFPGLERHSGHRIAAAQQSGWGSMISFELEGGSSAVQAFVGALKSFSLAESLGGVESLIAQPATMTHAAMSEEVRRRAGIRDGLLRLSVGVEPKETLLADLTQALAKVKEAR